MDARAIAEEAVHWYHEQLNLHRPHGVNVRRHLYAPVLALTLDVLGKGGDDSDSDSDNSANGVEEEKKCEGLVSDDERRKRKLQQWSYSVDSAEYKSLYKSLGRRDKARFDAFLAGVEIAVASEAVEEPERPPVKNDNHNKSPVLTSLKHNGTALLRSVSAEVATSIHPQIRLKGLRLRLELYLRSLHRVKSLQRACVIAVEPERAVKARAEMIVAAFISTVGCVRGVSPVLTSLLTNLTRELLAVEHLDKSLDKIIQRIVNEYEHGTSFASLAFLSSPEAAAETKLTPMVLRYIHFLQRDWKSHEAACELERMLSQCLDATMRHYFKTVEFQSIGHLLEVCQGFRNELQAIELTPSASAGGCGADLCNDPEAVRQAIRDLQREVITINGHVLPPVTSRKDLIHLLSQSLNSKSLTATKMLTEEQEREENTFPKSESCPSFISTEPSTDESNDFSPKANKRASFHLTTVDLLTRRLLIAASRTGTGGDSYFIVRDLFGDDDDVEVVPAKVLPHHVRASRVGSIEIQVRLASVTIKCHGSFDIYPKSLVGCCEPLIQLHTTSSETIYLQELRPSDNVDGLLDDGSRSSDGSGALVLQEKKTQHSGRRVLTIRPALYEKVQVFNTPS